MIAEAHISASPSFVSFYQVNVGSSQTRYVRISNDGREAVQVSVGGGCFGDIQTMSACNLTLEPFQSCSVTVRFSPRREGYQSCSFSASGSDGSIATVNVSGQGVDL